MSAAVDGVGLRQFRVGGVDSSGCLVGVLEYGYTGSNLNIYSISHSLKLKHGLGSMLCIKSQTFLMCSVFAVYKISLNSHTRVDVGFFPLSFSFWSCGLHWRGIQYVHKVCSDCMQSEKETYQVSSIMNFSWTWVTLYTKVFLNWWDRKGKCSLKQRYKNLILSLCVKIFIWGQVNKKVFIKNEVNY